jgi:hypothetical protein
MSIRYTNHKTRNMEHFGFVDKIPGIGNFWNMIRSIPGKIGDVFRGIFNGIKDGSMNLMEQAMNRFLEAMKTMLEAIFGPIFNPLMPYIWAIGIGVALLIITCIGALIFIFTRPDKCSCTQSGGFNNNIEMLNIIILVLISIIIFSKKKLEHFGFVPGINTIIDPIKRTFGTIKDGIVDGLGKLLRLIEENTIGRIREKINDMVSEIQVFLKPILIGGAVLLPLMCVGIIAFTFFFFGQDDKPKTEPKPTPAPAPAPAPAAPATPAPAPAAPAPAATIPVV